MIMYNMIAHRHANTLLQMSFVTFNTLPINEKLKGQFILHIPWRYSWQSTEETIWMYNVSNNLLNIVHNLQCCPCFFAKWKKKQRMQYWLKINLTKCCFSAPCAVELLCLQREAIQRNNGEWMRVETSIIYQEMFNLMCQTCFNNMLQSCSAAQCTGWV